MMYARFAVPFLFLGVALYGAEISQRVLTLCLADEVIGPSVCAYKTKLDLRLTESTMAYVPREQAGNDGFAAYLCSIVGAYPEDHIVLMLRGQGRRETTGWVLDWVDADGRGRRQSPAVKAQNIEAALATCLNPKERYSIFVDGNIAYDTAGNHASAKRAEFDLTWGLRFYAEVASAKPVGSGKPSRFNETLNDVPYLPLSESAAPGCQPLWRGIMEMDATALAANKLPTPPSPSTCRQVPKPLEQVHVGYDKWCAPFANGQPSSTSPAPGNFFLDPQVCVEQAITYRAMLRHWNTRATPLAQIDDYSLLLDKIVWGQSDLPAGVFLERQPWLIEVAERMTKLRPDSVVAQQVIASAAGFLSHELTDHGTRPDDRRVIQFRERAGIAAEKIVDLKPTAENASVFWEPVWYALTRQMEEPRLLKLAEELKRDSQFANQALYLEAYAKQHTDGAAATALLKELLKREPDNGAARGALAGSWSGITMNIFQGDIDYWKKGMLGQ